MAVSRQTEEQVLAVLDRLRRAMRDGDADRIAELTVPGFAGFGLARTARTLAEALPGGYALEDVAIACEGTVAWVSARLVPDDAPAPAGRCTLVLRGTGHAWLVAQLHASLPA